MLKLFSDIKKTDSQMFDDICKAAKSENGSDGWFTTKTYNEIVRCAEFCIANSWQVDMEKLQPLLTSFEFDMVQSMIKNQSEEGMKQRERACRTAAQKTQRWVESWMKGNETRAQIAELQAKVSRKPASDIRSQWNSLQSIFE